MLIIARCNALEAKIVIFLIWLWKEHLLLQFIAWYFNVFDFNFFIQVN